MTVKLILILCASINLATSFFAYIIFRQKTIETEQANKRAFVYRNELANILGLETVKHIESRNNI
jgi:uncharacterized protein YuzE